MTLDTPTLALGAILAASLGAAAVEAARAIARRWRHNAAVIAASPAVSRTPAEAAAVAVEAARRGERPPSPLTGREAETLARLAAQPARDRDVAVAREAAASLRRRFPAVTDADLGRAVLYIRWLAGVEHAAGRNLVQIGQLLGLVALDLTELARLDQPEQVRR